MRQRNLHSRNRNEIKCASMQQKYKIQMLLGGQFTAAKCGLHFGASNSEGAACTKMHRMVRNFSFVARFKLISMLACYLSIVVVVVVAGPANGEECGSGSGKRRSSSNREREREKSKGKLVHLSSREYLWEWNLFEGYPFLVRVFELSRNYQNYFQFQHSK